jgi:two-component system response regulator DesR
MRILLADNQADVRSALKFLLEQDKAHEIVAEVVHSSFLLDNLKVTSPDLILLDWQLPGDNLKDILARLREQAPGLAVIAMSGNPELSREALDAGAQRFISKLDLAETLLAVVAVLNGKNEGRSV